MMARQLPSGWSHIVRVGLIATMAACAHPARSSGTLASQTSTATERTVFTDSTLFRRVCTQADSGLTLSAGRCTPRNQALRIP
jgi:hypothetical protein